MRKSGTTPGHCDHCCSAAFQVPAQRHTPSRSRSSCSSNDTGASCISEEGGRIKKSYGNIDFPLFFFSVPIFFPLFLFLFYTIYIALAITRHAAVRQLPCPARPSRPSFLQVPSSSSLRTTSPLRARLGPAVLPTSRPRDSSRGRAEVHCWSLPSTPTARSGGFGFLASRRIPTRASRHCMVGSFGRRCHSVLALLKSSSPSLRRWSAGSSMADCSRQCSDRHRAMTSRF